MQGLDGEAELYRQHMPQLIGWLSQTQRTWTNYSIQRLQLEVLIVQSGMGNLIRNDGRLFISQ